MARKPTGNPVGRPCKPINWPLFEDLCSIQCTQAEIADLCHCDDNTLRDNVKRQYGEEFSVVYKRYSAPGKMSLRRYQYKQAERNATMAIWLGKQWLGQREDPHAVVVTEESLRAHQAIMDQLKNMQEKAKASLQHIHPTAGQ